MLNSRITKLIFLLILIILIINVTSATNVTSNKYNTTTNEKQVIQTEESFTTNNNTISTHISIDKINDTYYSEKINITGKCYQTDNKPLKSTSLNLKVNNNNLNCHTDNNGKFKVGITAKDVGINNISVIYKGDKTYKSTNTTATFTVIAQVTNLTLDEINECEYTDTIHIKGKYTDQNSKVLRYTNLIVKINNQKKIITTDIDGKYNLDYKTNLLGINNISIEYPGNIRYQGDKITSAFNVIPKTTVITVNNIENTQFTDIARITGKYTDSNSYRLSYTPLTLVYSNQKFINYTNGDGYFIFNIKTRKIGNNSINVSYPGNNKYSGTNIIKSFNVISKDTIIKINDINNAEYMDVITISGKYTDTNGYRLRYTPLNISVNNLKDKISTDKDGNFNYKYKTQKLGTNTLKVSFCGNKNYNMAETLLSFNVTQKSTNILINKTLNNNQIQINGKFVDTNNRCLRNTPLSLLIYHQNKYTNEHIIERNRVITDTNGNFKYNYVVNDYGTYTIKLTYYGNARYKAITNTTNIICKGNSNLFVSSLQGRTNKKTLLEVNVTDELNNSIDDGKLDLYLNNKLLISKNISKNNNTLTIPAQNTGVYNLKVTYTSDKYKTSSKNIMLSVNPESNYRINLLYNPAITHNLLTKITGYIRNTNNKTVNNGLVKFYLNNKYLNQEKVKNNLSKIRFNVTTPSGYYPVRIDYYSQDMFIGSDSDIIYIKSQEKQISQNTFISISSDLIGNSKVTTTKKDVYFAMDRTTAATYNYSPNDMKIMYNIANNLKINGFNVKTIRNGPGETYNTARYMYNNNIKNSICFVLCNGVDANVIREYLYGQDPLLTAVRKRGNDIVLGWFYGAGNIYDRDGEYYNFLEKAWDDNYSGKGGISYPRRTMEKDGIKVIYHKFDMNGQDVANSFVKLYGGKITQSVKVNSTISIKTQLYTTNNQKINGNIVYTLNGKIIKNQSVSNNINTITYKVPDIKGTYNLKTTYYSNNQKICQSWDRYIKVS